MVTLQRRRTEYLVVCQWHASGAKTGSDVFPQSRRSVLAGGGRAARGTCMRSDMLWPL